MPYFPKNQVETGLYSNGELSIQGSSTPYVGPYFITSNGSLYSGDVPNTGNNQPLLPTELINSQNANPSSPTYEIDNNSNNLAYSNITSPQPTPSYTPIPYTPIITDNDIKRGEITRFFAKKANENIYVETQFLPPPNQFMWEGIVLPWVIVGDNKLKVGLLNEKQVDFIIERDKIDLSFKTYIENDGKPKPVDNTETLRQSLSPRKSLLSPDSTLLVNSSFEDSLVESIREQTKSIRQGYGFERFYSLADNFENRTFVSTVADINLYTALDPTTSNPPAPPFRITEDYKGSNPNAQYFESALENLMLGTNPLTKNGSRYTPKQISGYENSEVSSGGDISIDLANLAIALFDFIDKEFLNLAELKYIPEDISDAWFNISKRVTGGNDVSHINSTNKNSRHRTGNGLDFVIGNMRGIEGGQMARNHIKIRWDKDDRIAWEIFRRLLWGATLGTEELGFINEYYYPSKPGLAAHIHISYAQPGFIGEYSAAGKERTRAKYAYESSDPYIFTWNGKQYTIYPYKVKLQYLDQTPRFR